MGVFYHGTGVAFFLSPSSFDDGKGNALDSETSGAASSPALGSESTQRNNSHGLWVLVMIVSRLALCSEGATMVR